MIQLFLEFLYNLFTIATAKQKRLKLQPVYALVFVVWLCVLFSLTLMFG